MQTAIQALFSLTKTTVYEQKCPLESLHLLSFFRNSTA